MAPPSLARDVRWAGLSAVAGVLLFAAANAIWAFEQPAPGSSADELVGFYEAIPARIVAGALLSLVAYASLVVCAAALRAVLVRLDGDELLGSVVLGGALLGLAAGASAEVINMAAAMRAADGELSGTLALALFDVSYVFGSYAGGFGFGVATVALSAFALRTGHLMARGAAIAGMASGAALVTPLTAYVVGEYTFLLPFALLLVLGARLLSGSASRPPAGQRTDA